MEWWHYVLGVLAFVIILGLIVLIHEGGHFLLARKAGILCHEFSIGMGPVLFQKKIGETVYSIRAIPIGGFVSMAGEEVDFDALKDTKKVKLEFDENHRIIKIIVDIDNPKYDGMTVYDIESYDIIGTKEEVDGELFMEVSSIEGTSKYEVAKDAMMYFPKKQMAQIAPYNRNFAHKTVWQRFLAVFAGPAMNFVLALLIFVVLGFTRGYPKVESTEIDDLDPKAPIYLATDGAIEKGDKIISIGGIEVTNWSELSTVMNKFAIDGKVDDKIFEGYLEIKYMDKSSNNEVKTVNVVPNTYIYAIQLVFDNPHTTVDNKHLIPYVGEFNKNNSKTLAAQAGLLKGDLITGVAIAESKKDSSEELTYTEVKTTFDLINYFKNIEESKRIVLRYERINEEGIKEIKYSDQIESYSKALLDASGIPTIKLEMGVSTKYEFNFLKLLYSPFVETYECVANIFANLGLLFNPKANVGLDDFSSFLGIYELITSSLAEGFNSLLYIAAFLSVNIGFVNLLPLPALDGGRLAFIIFEMITKKRPSPKVENIIHTVGLFALFALMGFIIINEILRYTGLK